MGIASADCQGCHPHQGKGVWGLSVPITTKCEETVTLTIMHAHFQKQEEGVRERGCCPMILQEQMYPGWMLRLTLVLPQLVCLLVGLRKTDVQQRRITGWKTCAAIECWCTSGCQRVSLTPRLCHHLQLQLRHSSSAPPRHELDGWPFICHQQPSGHTPLISVQRWWECCGGGGWQSVARDYPIETLSTGSDWDVCLVFEERMRDVIGWRAARHLPAASSQAALTPELRWVADQQSSLVLLATVIFQGAVRSQHCQNTVFKTSRSINCAITAKGMAL